MGSIIRVLISGLIGSFMMALPSIIKKLSIVLGFGLVTFTGMKVLLDYIKVHVINSISGMPEMAANIAGVLNIDTAFSIVMSAYAIKLALRTFGSAAGTVTKAAWRTAG